MTARKTFAGESSEEQGNWSSFSASNYPFYFVFEVNMCQVEVEVEV